MMTGRLIVVGFGPGSKEDMTIRAIDAIEGADLIVGYTTYVDILKEFFPHKTYKVSGMMREIERCKMAIEDALTGKNVAMVSSGDSGIYGMSGIIYQLVEDMDADIEVEVVPGITAASSASALLGSPLMHDTALISLSDLLTPLDLIMKRVKAAAESDMVAVFYNPKSKTRTDYLSKAIGILKEHRSPSTPIGIVRNIGRKDEVAWTTTFQEFDDSKVDMFCTVVVGNTQTYMFKDLMVTPRGYSLD